jgi:hypothetical protein
LTDPRCACTNLGDSTKQLLKVQETVFGLVQPREVVFNHLAVDPKVKTTQEMAPQSRGPDNLSMIMTNEWDHLESCVNRDPGSRTCSMAAVPGPWKIVTAEL